MRLRQLVLRNFRAYKGPTRIGFEDLTAIVGRNDIGKTSILEALDIVLEGGNVSLDHGDLCKDAGSDTTISLEVAFDELPDEIVIDSTVKTSLAAEQLLDADGLFRVRKTWDLSKAKPKVQIDAIAFHQTLADGSSPLQLTNAKLKAECKAAKVDTSKLNLTENPPLRAALRQSLPAPKPEVTVPLDEEGGKAIWEALQPLIPLFALFQSDRDSKDSDSEVQDPLKFAVSQAMKGQEAVLKSVQDAVTRQAQDVAERTLAKLKEMAPSLAAELSAKFDTPKWDSVFKASLTTDRGIPLNKRGSGVRRLILLNFFRAEAERQAESSGRPIIYAVEEPETSQHPDNQRMLVEAFKELAQLDGVQVIVTTHVPALAGMIATSDLRLLRTAGGQPEVLEGEGILADIAKTLGVFADTRLEVLVCVEGPTDIPHLLSYCRLLRAIDASLPDIEADPRIAVIPLGGGTLEAWVERKYLEKAKAKEYHIYDRDVEQGGELKYQAACDACNGRGNGHSARLTTKREIENYLHEEAIGAVFGCRIAVDDTCDVEAALEAARLAGQHRVRKRKIKSKLADAAGHMTVAMLEQRRGRTEIEQWLREIAELLRTTA